MKSETTRPKIGFDRIGKLILTGNMLNVILQFPPQKEIAVILRIKPEYVRVLSSRAKRELKRQMEALGYDV